MDLLSVSYLVLIIFGTSVQNVLKKLYLNKEKGGGVFVFSAFTVLTALCFFTVKSLFDFNFSLEVLPYAIGFATGYAFATVFNFLAIGCGPLSLTSLMLSYSLLIPTAWGVLFDGDEVGIFFYIGILLLAVSLVLVNAKRGECKITLKWALFALLALVGNGACSTFQAVQSKTFGGKYDGTFMVISLLMVVCVLFVLTFIHEKDKVKISLKSGIILMVGTGLANGLVNLLVMVCSATVNKSIMFPLISAGSIVLTWLISRFFYRERLTAKQNVGMLLGVASIVFLNL